MTYSIKEIFYTLQGEGANIGKPAVFCRFSGCNLWNGIEKHRENADCTFCDTDFIGTDGENGAKYKSSKELVKKINDLWPKNKKNKLVVFTGGEPLLQLDSKIIKNIKKKNFTIAVETNGTIKAPDGIDWMCVSPKQGTKLNQKKGDEIKVVYPQKDLDPAKYLGYKFKHYFLQPLDNHQAKNNMSKTIEYILKNPEWRISIQSHKILGLK